MLNWDRIQEELAEMKSRGAGDDPKKWKKSVKSAYWSQFHLNQLAKLDPSHPDAIERAFLAGMNFGGALLERDISDRLASYSKRNNADIKQEIVDIVHFYMADGRTKTHAVELTAKDFKLSQPTIWNYLRESK